jgi:GNAT superfamily N-acetyltransferase
MMDAPGNISGSRKRRMHYWQRSGWWRRGIVSRTQPGGLGGISSSSRNLVAQSLAAHGGSPLAATLRGLRVSRIAVHPSRQREGLGQALIAHAPACHGLRLSLGQFRLYGFAVAFLAAMRVPSGQLGSHREASSGCYTAMAYCR